MTHEPAQERLFRLMNAFGDDADRLRLAKAEAEEARRSLRPAVHSSTDVPDDRYDQAFEEHLSGSVEVKSEEAGKAQPAADPGENAQAETYEIQAVPKPPIPQTKQLKADQQDSSPAAAELGPWEVFDGLRARILQRLHQFYQLTRPEVLRPELGEGWGQAVPLLGPLRDQNRELQDALIASTTTTASPALSPAIPTWMGMAT